MLLDENVNTINKNTEALLEASSDVGVEVNTKISVCLSRHQNAGQNHNLMIANRSFDKCGNVQMFGTRVTNQNYFKEELSEH
jgi:hypothetical protein